MDSEGYETGYREGENSRTADFLLAFSEAETMDGLLERFRTLTGNPELEWPAPAKVYLATSGEYSSYRVRRAFARREDAEAYKLGDDVLDLEVSDGPVEVRRWHDLRWEPRLGDRAAQWPSVANPHVDSEYRDFDGDERHAAHHWVQITPGRTMLKVGGWDLALVKKVYSEQRAQYRARQEGIS